MSSAQPDAFAEAQVAVPPRPAARLKPLLLTPSLMRVAAPECPAPGAWLEAAICADTRLMTPRGPLPAGLLRVGDMLLTRDTGAQPIRWIGRHKLTPQHLSEHPTLRPVVVARGAFGGGTPRRDVRLSPRAGVIVTVPGGPADGAIAPASGLVGRDGVSRSFADKTCVTYVQILLPHHAVIVAGGLQLESFHPRHLTGRQSDSTLRAAVLAEMPELEHGLDLYGPDARPRIA